MERLYVKWCKSNGDKKFDKIYEYKAFLKEVIKITGVRDDYYVPNIKQVGYGKIQSSNVIVIENFPHIYSDMANGTLRIFSEMRGVLKERIFGTINPIYWLNIIIFLPQKIVKYLGLKETSILAKILNLLWWIIGIPITLLQDSFSDKLKVLIEKFFY